MTLVYNRPVTGHKTHALIIGIGRFPHLSNANMGACVDSAKAMLSFIYSGRDNFLSPLATIECVISDPAASMGSDKAEKFDEDYDPRENDFVDAATAKNVLDACRHWIDRCQPGDTLIFYACTHGVAARTERGLLVLEDYNSSRHNLGDHLLDAASLARTVAPFTKAGSVWMFIDACQEARPELLELKEEVRAIEPLAVTVTQAVQCRVDTLALISSRFGNFARTKKSGTAYFTQAIIEGMSTNLVEHKSGKWWVTGKQIQHGLKDTAFARYGHRLEASGLSYYMQDKVLVSVEEPMVPMLITSSPETLLAKSTTAHICEKSSSRSIVTTKPIGHSEWRCQLPLVRRILTVHLINSGVAQNLDFSFEAPVVLLEVTR